eukprot:gb/GFBE01056470.1/.p1 GENE.gb/GFBE01056470.1/~~gb/GFBE01056470.1/.p1  ORF type:complete len:378 (+),score=58.89 gb/GFBE01056470.1/:1-1134(+)
MGCGLVSQRGSAVLEVDRPISRDSGGRSSAASQRAQVAADSSSPSERRRRAGSNRDRSSSEGDQEDGDRPAAQQGGRNNARRFMVGERITVTTRLPHNIQDHAFCFECGVFFHVGTMTSPECANCGSSFVQFLRSTQDQNWISADNPNAQGFAFDDQLDNSISASLDETPIPRKPTQAGFLQSLKTVQLDAAEVKERTLLGASDPRSNCAICRETFAVGDQLQKLPCHHEFHADCILLWLKGNCTCPICRWQLPEAADVEEEQEEQKAVLKTTTATGPAALRTPISDEPAADAEEEEPPRRLPSHDGGEADEAVEEVFARPRQQEEPQRLRCPGSVDAPERSQSPSDLPGVASRPDESTWCRGAQGEPKPVVPHDAA